MREHSCELAAPAPHRLAWYEWGDPQAPETVVCVHGLTRNGRDFDFLAAALAPHYRVICPDMPGRGNSGWLPDAAHYNYLTYAADTQQLLAMLSIERFHWVGTSMGGIIGMMVAAAQPQALLSLSLNDIGSTIPAAGLRRILSYAGSGSVFENTQAAQTALRANLATFGIDDELHWRHIMEHSLHPLPDGKVRLAYDPKIVAALQAAGIDNDVDLTGLWEAAKPIRTLLVRGSESDILTEETAARMKASHARLTRLDIPGAGHAPALMKKEQTDFIRDWIASN